jgi:hypothetical protein
MPGTACEEFDRMYLAKHSEVRQRMWENWWQNR